MEKKDKILVPWDFTPVAENALKHAINMANSVNNEIVLLHIVKKEKDIPSALEDLNKIAELESKTSGIVINALVREGNIFTAIGEVADEIGVMLVVMGTHGIKGMQKLTGSWALKVIANSKVPFMVVQAPPHKPEINNIVVPIDYSVENKQKLKYAEFLSRYFHLKVNLYMYEYSDSTFKTKTKANMAFAKKYLKEKNIEFEVHISLAKGPLWKQTIEFAEEIDADMIMIMTTKDIGPTDFVFGADEQQVIANNSKIAVMAVNPKSFGIGGGITF